ncbi:MAG: hypothetical protein M3Z36_14720 [Acidobacteriota bacterium]|nr:hypothetical protein [Acidobacteriota bacterium]
MQYCLNGLIAAIAIALMPSLSAGEGPYFVTYTHRMEEPGNLEFATRSVTIKPSGANRTVATVAEFEYGVKAWWTSELYLDGQTTARDSTLFTGYRWENRFRLLPREHWINPVFYFEFENINGADRNLLAVVGHDGEEDLTGRNGEAREEKKRELEAKLILSSNVKGWNISGNFIAEKNVRHAPFEFGYAVGVNRPFALAARAERCQFCPENFSAGVEVYGGLGTHESFGLRGTSHYVAPTLSWTPANGSTTFKLSPGFGVTPTSLPFLLRFGVSYEVTQLGRSMRQWLR